MMLPYVEKINTDYLTSQYNNEHKPHDDAIHLHVI
jgi:hypothetical protein